MSILMVISGEKTFIGSFEGDIVDGGVALSKALEIREMFVPAENGQIQRMVNFLTISPFDKTPHSIRITKVDGYVDVADGSDTLKHYEAYLSHLSAENAGISLVQPGSSGANFSGKFGPMR